MNKDRVPYKTVHYTDSHNETAEQEQGKIKPFTIQPCLLFSLSRMVPLTFPPSSYTTACVLCPTRWSSSGCRHMLAFAGNETVDRLEKAEPKLPQPHLSTSYKEVKTLLKQKQKSAWRFKSNGYDPQRDQINTLYSRTQTTIFSLRTSHCGLRKHLNRLGLADSAHCECSFEEQTPEHFLQTCPHQGTVRQNL